MKLRDFLKVFDIHAPYYIRELHNGVGKKFLVYNDDYIENEKEFMWLSSDVTGLGVSVHGYLGALLEVTISV